MRTYDQRLQAANSLLALYAVPHHGTLGRPISEPEDETRFPFQRDRGRIIHCQAFRRLQGKTQVFVAGEGDHFRTRLTHTMEVTQIARDVARTLSLNEDLTECIALVHDLGHPPFGHMGEQALDSWMQLHHSHFEHNEQSLRIVTLLEDHSPLAPGLNLNREVLDGIQKHGSMNGRGGRGLSLEAQVVNLCDEIAYLGHDTEDGLRAELFTLDDLHHIPLVTDARALADARQTSLRGSIVRLLTNDLYTTGIPQTIHTLDDVYASSQPILRFSDAMKVQVSMLRSFLYERMYGHPRVRDANLNGQAIIQTLCAHYEEQPTEKIISLQQKIGSTMPEAIKDYVAGMTDAFARAMAGTAVDPQPLR